MSEIIPVYGLLQHECNMIKPGCKDCKNIDRMDSGYKGLLAAIFLLVAANHVSAATFNETCGTNLRLDCGNAPIIIIKVTSRERFDSGQCRAGKIGSQPITVDDVRQRCEGENECNFVTGFTLVDLKYLSVYYDCGQSNDICSDVTIQSNESYLNLLGQAGLTGPAKCSCEATVPPGMAVSVQVLEHKFSSPGTVLALKWRDDATSYVEQSTRFRATPIKHNVTDKFKIEYETDGGNNDLLLYYKVAEPIKMVCNNGSEKEPVPVAAPGPTPRTGSEPGPGEETSTSGVGKEQEGDSPIGAIVGGVVAGIVVVAVVVFLIVFFVKRRSNKKGDEEAVDPLTVEQHVGSGKSDKESSQEAQDTPVYESITKYGPNLNEDGEKRGSVELPKSESIELSKSKTPSSKNKPKGPSTTAKHTPSFGLSDSDADGDYAVIDVAEEMKVSNPNGQDKKGILGWLGQKIGIGAKRTESEQDKKENVKPDSSRKGNVGQKGSSNVQEENYDKLRKPLLTDPPSMQKPVSPTGNYDHIEPSIDHTKDSPDISEKFPNKITSSGKLAKNRYVQV